MFVTGRAYRISDSSNAPNVQVRIISVTRGIPTGYTTTSNLGGVFRITINPTPGTGSVSAVHPVYTTNEGFDSLLFRVYAIRVIPSNVNIRVNTGEAVNFTTATILDNFGAPISNLTIQTFTSNLIASVSVSSVPAALVCLFYFICFILFV